MNNHTKEVSAISVALILVGALFGASSASGQEILKFFGSYGLWGVAGLLFCFCLYTAFGYMTYELCRDRVSPRMEEVVSPVENHAVRAVLRFIMFFGIFMVLTALLSAGDALFQTQLHFPRGVGGGLIAILIVLTNIFGFDGVKRVLTLVVPVMMVSVIAISLAVILWTPHGTALEPQRFQSPLAPHWLVGGVLYLTYNFILAIPIFSTLPNEPSQRKKTVVGMVMGFAGIIGIGFLIFLAIRTDLDVAGTYDLPMIYLAGKLSPVVRALYFVVMVIAVYCASANTLFGLTRDMKGGRSLGRAVRIFLICLAAYLISLMGFAFLVTYAYPVQGYACILVTICLVITFVKHRRQRVAQR